MRALSRPWHPPLRAPGRRLSGAAPVALAAVTTALALLVPAVYTPRAAAPSGDPARPAAGTGAGGAGGARLGPRTGSGTDSGTGTGAGAAGGVDASAATYTNPVSAGTVDTFPDPSMIRGHDGAWYAYSTTNPIRVSHGDNTEHILPVLRSTDLIAWSYVGDLFTAANHPSWWPAATRPWAPDVHYIDGSYHVTYSLSGGGVGLATSPNPTGPWTDRGQLVPSGTSGCPTFDIDQSLYTDITGDNYLYWGSYDTICVAKLNAAATALAGTPTQVARGRRMEGGFVVRRDARYYLFYSDAGCCDGVFSGYSVKVGRASSPLGPFTTASGVDLMALTSKDSIVVSGRADTWVGPGHNSLQTDLAGQDFLVYHAIDPADPKFGTVNTTFGTTITGLSKRPLMIDRLDWINGWPVVRAGAGPSTSAQPGPVTTWSVGSTFNDGIPAGWTGGWGTATGSDALTFLRSPATTTTGYQTSAGSAGGDLRVEADIRFTASGSSGSAGLVVSRTDAANSVIAWLDRGLGQLVLGVTAAGATTTYTAALPAGFAYARWHNIAAERRGTTLVVWVTSDRQRDAVATITATLPAAATAAAPIGVAASGAQVDADNVGAAPLYAPVTARVADPVLGALLPAYSDDFSGAGRPEAVDPAWSWVRGTAASPAESGGALVWPTTAGDLKTTTNTAPVLLRAAPSGDFVVETRLTFTGTAAGPHAGILLYDTDDRYLRLTHSVLELNRGNGAVVHVSELGAEYDPGTGLGYGPMFGGPTATTLWLRLAHHADAANGEHDVRMATSTDGVNWTWGGAWALPGTGALRIGLVSANGTGATASFDYLHTYRLTAP